jgi:hypothetical protein
MQPLEQSADLTQGDAHAEPVKLLKRIGSATVEVTIHFSSTSNETMADITRRLLSRATMAGEHEPGQNTGATVIPFAPPTEREVKKSA